MSLNTPKQPVLSAFHWRGKSETLDKFGRMKTIRQMHLDGNRTNEFVPPPTQERDTKSFKSPR
jgi:hypothetical protein